MDSLSSDQESRSIQASRRPRSVQSGKRTTHTGPQRAVDGRFLVKNNWENMCPAARVIVAEIGEIEALPRCFGFAAFHSPDE